MAHTARLQKRLWDGLKARVPYLKLNGPDVGPKRISTNLNLSTTFIEGEGQLLLCDHHGIAVASGSSCVSKSLKIGFSRSIGTTMLRCSAFLVSVAC